MKNKQIDYKLFYKEVQIYFKTFCTNDIRKHSYAKKEDDLKFQIFRILLGYQKALTQLDTLFENNYKELKNEYKKWKINKQGEDKK